MSRMLVCLSRATALNGLNQNMTKRLPVRCLASSCGVGPCHVSGLQESRGRRGPRKEGKRDEKGTREARAQEEEGEDGGEDAESREQVLRRLPPRRRVLLQDSVQAAATRDQSGRRDSQSRTEHDVETHPAMQGKMDGPSRTPR